MNVEKKVPEIRFKGFSGEWVEEILEAVAEIKTGPFGSTLHAKAYVEDGHAIITTEHFKSGELPVDKRGIPQVSDDDYLRLKAYLLKVGDIVFSRVGSVDINAHVTNKQEGWLFSGRVLRVRSGKIIDSEYLHHELSTSRVKKSVVSRAVGQTMPSINTEILKITPIHFPLETAEQTQIGHYFQKLDSLINQHQQKHNKLSNIKKAMLEKMFPKQGETIPEIRFKGFSGEWEETVLSEITDKYDNLRVAVTAKDRIAGNTPYYGANGIQGYVEGYTHYGEYVLLAEDGANDLKNYPIHYVNEKVWVNNHAHVLKAKENSSNIFLKYALNNIDFEPFLVGGGRAKLNASIMMNLTLTISTDIKEQTSIGKYFQKLDTLINQHQQQITKLNNIKQACLSKMFV